MRNYIKLLSVALLVGSVTQVNASGDPIAEAFYKAGFTAATLDGKAYTSFTGFPNPDSDVLNAVRSKLRAREESLAPTARVAAPVGNVAALMALGLSATAAAFVDILDTATVGAKVTGVPAIDFATGVAEVRATAAAYRPAVDALELVPGFSTLKSGNKAYFVAALKTLLAAKGDIADAIAESATTGGLTAASGTLSGKAALVRQVDAKAAPAKVLANLFEEAYNASGVQTVTPQAAWLDAATLPPAVKAELEKEATWTAILAAIM